MDSVILVGRLLVSLAFVLGVMWLIARRAKKSGGRARDGRMIQVLGRQQLSRSASVAIVRILDQALVIGVTDGQVSVLGEANLEAAEAAVVVPESARGGKRRASSASRKAQPKFRAQPKSTGAPAHRTAPPVRIAPPAATSAPLTPEPAATSNAGPLTGSALSPHTWKLTLDALRDMTSRSA